MLATSIGGRLRGDDTGERGTSSVLSKDRRDEIGAFATETRVESGLLSLGARPGTGIGMATTGTGEGGAPMTLASEPEPPGNVLRKSGKKLAGSVDERVPGSGTGEGESPGCAVSSVSGPESGVAESGDCGACVRLVAGAAEMVASTPGGAGAGAGETRAGSALLGVAIARDPEGSGGCRSGGLKVLPRFNPGG